MAIRISKNRVALENIPLNLSAAALNEAAEVSIASAATVAAGITRKGRFSGALTFTHNATSLILPGAANITTAANHTFEAMSLGGGNWIVTKYQKADGTAVVGSTQTIQTFTANDTYTKPAGLKYALVRTQAGGGGGGGGGGASTGGGGGGGGGYAEELLATASIGATETVTVGGGGAGGVGAANGAAGGTSSFGALNSATGGSGGTGTGGGQGGAGGAGTGGNANGGGGAGVSGNPTWGGIGGSSMLGGGGISGTSSAGAGTGYGGGGGAATSSGNGGAGAGGIVIVLEYY